MPDDLFKYSNKKKNFNIHKDGITSSRLMSLYKSNQKHMTNVWKNTLKNPNKDVIKSDESVRIQQSKAHG